MHFNLLRKTSFTLSLIAICISGYAQESSFEHYQIDINGKRHDFFEFIEHVEIIRLEETNNSLLPPIWSYLKTPNGYALAPGSSKVIYLFNDEGNYKGQISRYGKGPNEYQEITSFWFHNGYIELFSSSPRILQRYTEDGEYIETINAGFGKELRAGTMIPYNSGYLFQLIDPSMKNLNTLWYLQTID